MSRFKYLLDEVELSSSPRKLFGLFPFDTLIESKTSDISSGNLNFMNEAMEALKILAQKNYEVVLFINQFKNKPLPYETFQSMNNAIESAIRGLGMNVAGLYWCPSTDRNDPFVVPNAGMFNRANENQGIKWAGLSIVSTNDADLKAAEKVKALPIRIGKGQNKWTQFESIYEWAKSE